MTARRLVLASLLGLTLGCAAAGPVGRQDLAPYLQVRRQDCLAEGGRWTASNFCERQACGM
jgi:hypothetical protein